jgi:hypothetical protein
VINYSFSGNNVKLSDNFLNRDSGAREQLLLADTVLKNWVIG